MARSRLYSALAGLLLAGSAYALPADQLYTRLAPSVWQVVAFDAQGKPVGIGSAVVIGHETLLTNCHVLVTGRSAAVRQDNRAYGISLQYVDIEDDLCQITARNLPAPAVEIGDSDKLAVGSRIYALGNPQGLELTLSDGLISALRRDSKQALSWIQISAPISPGSSGGGVFDENGQLIGITTATMRSGQNLNIAVPIKLIKNLPERHAVWQAQADARKKAAAGPATARAPSPSTSPSTSPSSSPSTSQSPAPAPAPALSASPSPRPVPQASGFAAIDDIAKFKSVVTGDGPEANYRRYLNAPTPRAFAISDDGHTWLTWSLTPKDKTAPREPAERVIKACEAEYKQHCYLYAVDATVVYRPPQAR
ncbi:S1C family serine protease [Pseudoduganella sp. RAF53_2]|uniref:S1C family serine protease n=1 Tax=unclassified Pseudoduganella TaxID=2637179 RepID=UPI003F974D96